MELFLAVMVGGFIVVLFFIALLLHKVTIVEENLNRLNINKYFKRGEF
tara:strand:+ start:107 stop:250 length:144 start_codon:yes stop_codon:yes gene_type:complete